MAHEIEMLQGIFSLDELMARELMGAADGCLMVDIQDDTKRNYRKHSQTELFADSCL